MSKFYSQSGQDSFLENNIFKGYKKGFFVDVGAHNGKQINNTLYFEEKNDWTGINVEPLTEVYQELIKNRPNCINLNCAISDKDGTADFIKNTGYTEMLSGLRSAYDPRHFHRRDREIEIKGGSTKVVKVETKRLETVFDEHNVKRVNYLSIDVEGAEFNVIRSINFDKVFIDVIEFENNYDDNSVPIVGYLQKKGYKIIHKNMDIFMIHKDSEFTKKN